MQKEKTLRMVSVICSSVVCLVIVGWIGYSAYGYFRTGDTANTTVSRTEVNVDALSDYLSSLQTTDSVE